MVHCSRSTESHSTGKGTTEEAYDKFDQFPIVIAKVFTLLKDLKIQSKSLILDVL